ncbi:MAG: WbuC family cupin fold metalloprotein [Thermodesulfobacteriota bacterium]
MKRISNERLDGLTKAARTSSRKRMNYDIHQSPDERVQRFFNAFESDTYVRPHRHAEQDRFELFLCIRGKGAAIIFDGEGNATDTAVLSPEGECIGVDIPPGIWHTIIALTPGTIFFEVKEGPYRPLDDKEFAPWAPEPESPDERYYLKELKERVAGGSSA